MSDEESDDELLARLSAVVDAEIGRVPSDLSEFARAAQVWSVVDEELAELVETEPATVRSSATAVTGIFEMSALEISVVLRGAVLVGEISPPDDDVSLAVETLAGVQPIELDELGRFRAAGVYLPFRIRLEATPQRVGAVTPWLTH